MFLKNTNTGFVHCILLTKNETQYWAVGKSYKNSSFYMLLPLIARWKLFMREKFNLIINWKSRCNHNLQNCCWLFYVTYNTKHFQHCWFFYLLDWLCQYILSQHFRFFNFLFCSLFSKLQIENWNFFILFLRRQIIGNARQITG